MRVLVTGGAGYIGSHAVRALADAGHEVVVLDDLSTGHRAAVDGRARLFEADLRDRRALDEVLPGVDAVVHFAARSVVSESVRRPLDYWDVNLTGSLALLRAMSDHGVRRLVFSSTAATYGIPDRMPITEDVDQRPINPYGASKLAVERAIRDVLDADPTWSAAILRYFNVAGCASDGSLGEDHQPETHLLPIVLQAAAGRRSHVTLFGTDYDTPDGTCIRDYVHVEDLVAAHLVALEALRPGDLRVHNVGIGRGYSVREVVDAVRRVTGRSFDVREGARRPGDPPSLVTDPSSLVGSLGWRPRHTDIDAIVRTAWAWVQAHPEGYGDRG